MTQESVQEPIENRARTKIVATVGPACSEPGMLGRLVKSGVDVFRLNMAHGTPAVLNPIVDSIRQIGRLANRPVGILIDLAGPKIRLGKLAVDPTECALDQTFRFVRDATNQGTHDLSSNYDGLIDELETGDRVLLADGTVSMVVTSKDQDSVECRVTGPGLIGSRQGINLPGAKLSVPALSDTDIENAKWAARAQVEFISLSFVRSPNEVRKLKEIVQSQNSSALVIAKIEKPEALTHLEEIVHASDGIMVARGDLGVEIDVAEMPVQQKRIIDVCTKYRRPVIVATQMLDSMQRASRPTRAEVTDVANAILDGADACMLSGETAVGKFPVESVEMMNRIMLSTERTLEQRWGPAGPFSVLARDSNESQDRKVDTSVVQPITSSLVSAAGQVAAELNAKIVVVATRTGKTAIAKAKRRDSIPTLAVSNDEAILGQLTLFWGIDPVKGTTGRADEEMVEFIESWGKTNGALTDGDIVVIVGTTGSQQNRHNTLLVHKL